MHRESKTPSVSNNYTKEIEYLQRYIYFRVNHKFPMIQEKKSELLEIIAHMERRNEEKFDQTIQQQIEKKEIQIDFIEQYAQPDFPEESWNANTQWMQILSIPERLVCLMAFANQVFPKVWDTFFTVAGGRVGKGAFTPNLSQNRA